MNFHRNHFVTSLPLFLFFLSFLTSCEGPPGADANATCTQCHNSGSLLVSVTEQWRTSVHASGENTDRNGTTCAMCHTSEGFRECISGNKTVTNAPISNASSIGCRTCHKIHESYDTSDWELRTKNPVQLMISGEILNQGKGNICINCHQPRIPDPLPVLNGNSVTIRSAYWGPHHSTQASIIRGSGGIPLSGSEPYSNSSHSDLTNGCVTCHMASATGIKSGGHTMKITYESHGATAYNFAGCKSCHNNTTDLTILVETVRNETDSLLAQLEEKLREHNILNASNQINVSSGSSLELTSDQAGALLNYLLVKEDRSGGVHNYRYAKALLKNSIEKL